MLGGVFIVALFFFRKKKIQKIYSPQETEKGWARPVSFLMRLI